MFMRTSSRIAGIVVFGLGLSLPCIHAATFEAGDHARVEKAPLPSYPNPQAALRAGIENFRAGDPAAAIEALKYASAGGERLAQWKLAKLYASGEGVPRNDLKAYELFSQIVANYDEDNPDRRDAAIVSSAF